MGKITHADPGEALQKETEYMADTSHLDSQGNTLEISRSATLIVASSGASAKSKAGADYVCGDGTYTTDDQYIRAAITAIATSGGTIILTEGTFTIKALIYNFTTEQGINIIGQGRGTTISHEFNGDMITSQIPTGGGGLDIEYYFSFKDFRIYNNRSYTGTIFNLKMDDDGAADFGVIWGLTFENIFFDQCLETCYYSDIAWQVSFRNCTWNDCGDATHQVVYLGTSTNSNTHQVVFDNCIWQDCKGIGLYGGSDVNEVTLYQPYFDGGTATYDIYAPAIIRLRVFGGQIAGKSTVATARFGVYNTISGAFIYNTAGYYAIDGGNSSYRSIFTGCVIEVTTGNIALFEGTDYLTFIGNTIINVGTGMLFKSCQSGKFINNTVMCGTGHGIQLYGAGADLSNYWTIQGNDFIDTGSVVTPVSITGGDSNKIIGNNFIGTAAVGNTGTNSIIKDNSGYLAPGEVRSVTGSLTAGNANAIAFAWHNPNAQDILIKKVVVEVTTAGGTVGSHLDVGIADDVAGTNRGTEFFDDLLLNTPQVDDSWVAGDGGTQTKFVLCQDSVSATDGWVVGQILDANAASLVGSYYIEYMGR